MKIILAGGSGFLGMEAAQFFKQQDYEVVILSRKKSNIKDGIAYVHWDGKNAGDWETKINDADILINFVGKSVNCIYTEQNKKEIIASRIDAIQALDKAILKAKNPPRLFIQAASLAIYGDTKSLCNETSKHGEGFSAEVCKIWESAFLNTKANCRKVLLRIGFVLGKNGGVLDELKWVTKLYLGGSIGSGKQFISWLHIHDLNRMYQFAIDNEKVEGTYNATGTKAITNREFMKSLRKAMGKSFGIPSPTLIVKIGARFFLKTDASLALTGRNCIPQKFIKDGFQFQFTDLEKTLDELTN
jgi:uncharacterized protein